MKSRSGLTRDRAIAIDYLETRFPKTNIGIAYVYFNYKEGGTQTLLNVVSSLVAQLLPQTPGSSNIIQKHSGDRKQVRQISRICDMLWSCISFFKEAFCIIDALDDCDERLRAELLAILRRAPENFRLFCTSRPLTVIADMFPKALRLHIRATDADIETYVRARIKITLEHKLLKSLPADSQAEYIERIVSRIIEKARGMYVLLRQTSKVF